MKVITLKQHNPDGNKPRYPGDIYELSESSARTMEMLGYVKMESAEPVQVKRQYKRRDMKAEG